MASRKYDIVLLGATGYTGELTAKHVAARFPADVRWAIAGRSKSKLHDLAAELRGLRPNGSQPEIEVVDLDEASGLGALVKQTKVLISVVTYLRVGGVVIQSCIDHRTDYIDTAGDTAEAKDWIEHYHQQAEAAGVALIHSCGMLTGPHDVLALASARQLKKTSGSTTKEFVLSVREMGVDVSGGTFEAVSSRVGQQHDPVLQNPWVLSPVKRTVTAGDSPPSSAALGLRDDASLGLISKHNFTAAQNQAVVHRTWGLLHDTDEDWGPNFRYNEYTWVGSTIKGFLTLISGVVLSAVMGSSIGVGLLKFVMPAPGKGPDVNMTAKRPVRLEGIAIPDDNKAKRVKSVFAFPSGAYHITALFLAEGAASLLYKRDLVGGLRGGCLTPAILGEDLVERLKSAGATITVEVEK